MARERPANAIKRWRYTFRTPNLKPRSSYARNSKWSPFSDQDVLSFSFRKSIYCDATALLSFTSLAATDLLVLKKSLLAIIQRTESVHFFATKRSAWTSIVDNRPQLHANWHAQYHLIGKIPSEYRSESQRCVIYTTIAQNPATQYHTLYNSFKIELKNKNFDIQRILADKSWKWARFLFD